VLKTSATDIVMMGKNFVKIDKAPRSKHRHAEETEEEEYEDEEEEEEQNEWAGIVKKNVSCSKGRHKLKIVIFSSNEQ